MAAAPRLRIFLKPSLSQQLEQPLRTLGAKGKQLEQHQGNLLLNQAVSTGPFQSEPLSHGNLLLSSSLPCPSSSSPFPPPSQLLAFPSLSSSSPSWPLPCPPSYARLISSLLPQRLSLFSLLDSPFPPLLPSPPPCSPPQTLSLPLPFPSAKISKLAHALASIQASSPFPSPSPPVNAFLVRAPSSRTRPDQADSLPFPTPSLALSPALVSYHAQGLPSSSSSSHSLPCRPLSASGFPRTEPPAPSTPDRCAGQRQRVNVPLPLKHPSQFSAGTSFSASTEKKLPPFTQFVRAYTVACPSHRLQHPVLPYLLGAATQQAFTFVRGHACTCSSRHSQHPVLPSLLRAAAQQAPVSGRDHAGTCTPHGVAYGIQGWSLHPTPPSWRCDCSTWTRRPPAASLPRTKPPLCSFLHTPSFDAPASIVRQLIITACGPDRPGIVSNLSKRVLEFGGNVEESRMARLAGEFSIIMLVSVDGSVPRISEELRQRLLELEGLQITLRWAEDFKRVERRPGKKFRRLLVRGADNPGLVYNVTEYLAGRKINIENLETATEEAPFGGTTLFTMDGIIAMPLSLPTKELQRSLDVLQNNLGVMIELVNMDPGRKEEDVHRFWEQAQTVGGASRYSMLAQKDAETGRGDKLI